MPQGTEINMAAGARANPDPRRYFEAIGNERGPSAEQEPICLYLETTNRCNLLCTTCPRTYEELEPPADMSWDLFRKIVDQLPNIERAVAASSDTRSSSSSASIRARPFFSLSTVPLVLNRT